MQRFDEEIQVLVVDSSFAYKVHVVMSDTLYSKPERVLTSQVVLQSNSEAGQVA